MLDMERRGRVDESPEVNDAPRMPWTTQSEDLMAIKTKMKESLQIYWGDPDKEKVADKQTGLMMLLDIRSFFVQTYADELAMAANHHYVMGDTELWPVEILLRDIDIIYRIWNDLYNNRDPFRPWENHEVWQ